MVLLGVFRSRIWISVFSVISALTAIQSHAAYVECSTLPSGGPCTVYYDQYPILPERNGTCSTTTTTQWNPSRYWCQSDDTTTCIGKCLTEYDYRGVLPVSASCTGGTCNCGVPPFLGATCVPSVPTPTPTPTPSPTATPDCPDIAGTTQSFVYTPPTYPGYLGTCGTGAFTYQCNTLYPNPPPIINSDDEMCLYVAKTAPFIEHQDGDGGLVLISPAANPSCTCTAYPRTCTFRCESSPIACGIESGTWHFQSCSTTTAACQYSVGSGLDCTALSCATGTKYLLYDVGSFSQFLAETGGAAHPSFTCRQNSTTTGLAHTMYVACAGSAPDASYRTCTDNPDATYYQKLTYSLGCGANEFNCAAGTPTPTPTPTPSSCDLNLGGAGRSCNGTAGTKGSCCTGYTCEVAGAQPVNLTPDLPAPVAPAKYRSGFTHSPSTVDPIATGVNPGASNLDKTTGPQMICVGPAPAPTAPPVASASDFYHLPRALDGKVQKEAIKWDSAAGVFKCMLRIDHVNRESPGTPDGCQCRVPTTPKYGGQRMIPVVVTPAQYVDIQATTIADSSPKNKREWLWAKVVEALDRQQRAVKTSTLKLAKKTYDRLVPDASACYDETGCAAACNDGDGLCPSCCCTSYWSSWGYANYGACMCALDFNNTTGCGASTGTTGMSVPCCPTAGDINDCANVVSPNTPLPDIGECASGTPAPLPPRDILVDYGTMNSAGTAVLWAPWLVADQNYGFTSSGTSIAAGADNTTKIVACVPACPAGATQCRDSTQAGCTDTRACTCTATGAFFNPNTWACETCAIEGQYPDDSGTCVCPTDYTLRDIGGGVQACRPVTPANVSSGGFAAFDEYILSAGYPVCGPNRLPTTYNLQVMNYASNDVPRSSLVTSGSRYPAPYPFSSPAQAGALPSPSPYYLYWNQPHCACSQGVTSPTTPQLATIEVLSTSLGTGSRMYPDTLDAISSRGVDNKPDQRYAQVPIANDNGATLNPLLGSVFSSGASSCGCPNVNEVAVQSSVSDRAGHMCLPAINSPMERLLFSTFDRSVHTAAVITTEPTDGSGSVVDTIKMPQSPLQPGNLQNYRRGIWLCQPGYTLTNSSGSWACEFDVGDNACDATSEVSHRVTGGDYSTRFGNSVNPKAGCCGYQFGPSNVAGGPLVKFDCVANEGQATSFDQLWASADPANDGGNLNLLVLADKRGKELTGWYRLDGSRCDEFGSVAPGNITRGVIKPALSTGPGGTSSGQYTFTAKTGASATIAVPTSAKFATLISGLNGNTTGLSRAARPQPESGNTADILKAYQCPIFIRAAAVYGCDKNAVNTPVVRTIEESAGKFRCAAAARTMIHFRVEQVFDIAGQRNIPPKDTFIEESQVKFISLKELWEVNGFGECPKPAKRVGEACVW